MKTKEQIAAVGPGFNITRTDAQVGGEPAVVVDGLPDPDPLRRVFVVHENRLYDFIFMPWVTSPDSAAPLIALDYLYSAVM